MIKRLRVALIFVSLVILAEVGILAQQGPPPIGPAPGNGAGGAVASVFGRTGAVVAASNDYSFSQISGSVAAAQLPNPSSSTLGGVQSKAAVSHNFLTSISTSGVPAAAQPACADISDAGNGCTLTKVGTDAGLATAGTIGTTIKPVCSTTNGGVSTAGCLPDLTAAGSVWWTPAILWPQTSASAASFSPGGANQPTMYLFNLPVPAKVTTIIFATVTGVAASHGDIGMYSISGTTLTLVWHTGSFSTVTSSVVASVAITPVTLAPGQYYLASCSDANTSTTVGAISQSAVIGAMMGAASPAHTWGSNSTDTCTAGVLPSTQTSTNIANGVGTQLAVPVVKIWN